MDFGFGIMILGLFLFLSAGDIAYWNAWLYLTVLAGSGLLIGVYLFRNSNEVLQKKPNSKEKEKGQDIYSYSTGISLFLILGLSGLDYRLGWSCVHLVAVLTATVVMLLGIGLITAVLKQNSFATKTVGIQKEQKVVDTGVYSVIRHPMYAAVLTIFLASPVLLGSYYALIPIVFFLTGVILRIKREEKILCKGLDGYSDYMEQVKYKMIPYIW